MTSSVCDAEAAFLKIWRETAEDISSISARPLHLQNTEARERGTWVERGLALIYADVTVCDGSHPERAGRIWSHT